MTGSALERLVRNEIRCARLRFRFEVRRNPVGLYLMLWSDWAWLRGIAQRRVYGHDDIRRRESNIGVLVLHSRVPTIVFGGEIAGADPLRTLYPPPKCRESVLRALVFYAVAETIQTPWRIREARQRLRAAGVRLADYQQKPTFGRRGA